MAGATFGHLIANTVREEVATLHAGHHSRAQLPRPRGTDHRLHQPQLEILLRRGPAGVYRDARAMHRGRPVRVDNINTRVECAYGFNA